MKKILPLVIVIAFFFRDADAQYTFSPSITFTQKADTNSHNYNGITIVNQSSSDLYLKWKLTFIDTVPGSYFDFCETGNCFLGIPDSGNITTIPPSQIGFLKMHFWAGSTPGISTAKVYVYEPSAPANGDTLTYILVVSGGTGINDVALSGLLNVFPNPTSGKFSVIASPAFSDTKQSQIEIYNSLGEKIYSTNSPITQSHIDLSQKPDGLYFLKIKTEKGIVSKKIVLSR